MQSSPGAIKRRVTIASALILGLLFCVPSLYAAVTLSKVFSDHMVLQRERPAPIWGWANPGEKVVVEFAGQRKEATAGSNGSWEIRLDPMPACKEGRILLVSDGAQNSVKFNDVVVGEVWICSGQSNMGVPLGNASAAQQDIEAADLPDLRFFSVFNYLAASPEKMIKARAWSVCSTQTAANCSAVGFYFGRRLHAELGVPVGLIVSVWGGTFIEPWTPMEAFDTIPELADYIATARKDEQINRQAADATNTLVTNKSLPAVIYNAKVYPLIPYAIRGAIWYQGEANTGDQGDLYYHKMRALIGGWRRAWGQGNFPFYFVQLPNWSRDRAKNNPAGGDGWANIQQCQFKALAVTNTGMAVAIDIGEAANIHPTNKFDVGERLAFWALARDYGQTNVVRSGPLYRDLKIETSRIRLFFDHVGGGLMVGEKIGREPTRAVQNGKLQRFAVAGEDKKWGWADAVIDGDTVVVSSTNVPNPIAVRYAYSNNPEGCNLYNRAGLPASPFRTDAW